MTVEDRIHRALHAQASRVAPGDRWAAIDAAEPSGIPSQPSPARRALVAAAVLALFVVAASLVWTGFRPSRTTAGSEDVVRSPVASATVAFASADAPWTFEAPATWDVRTTRHAGPDLKADVLETTVANVPIPDHVVYGPNTSANASAVFGDAGAVVIVERLWTPGTPVGGEPQGPGPFAADAQNPGWTFRERLRCDGTLCFHVIEWLGPAASDADRAAAAAVADSVRLGDVERWTESDGVKTTLHDEDDGFAVTYPSDWKLSTTPINDRVCSPFEILALATYPLRPGGEAVTDFQLPANAVEDLGPSDILIWLDDGGNACGGTRRPGSGDGFPERPDAFGPVTLCGGSVGLCPSDGRDLVPGIRAWWIAFADEGRGFYAFVGMGEQAYADPDRAQQAWDVLDSLRFLPR